MKNELIKSQEGTALQADDPLIAAVVDELGGLLFTGKFLKFTKGTWKIGDTVIGASSTFLVNVPEWYRGWILWCDGEPADHIIGRVIDGFVPARDPPGEGDWQPCVYLALRDTADHEFVTFASCSDGGRKAVAHLIYRARREGLKHPGECPIVSLGSESYRHDQYGTVHKPLFRIVGWRTWDDDLPPAAPVAPVAPAACASSDELPPVDAYDDIPF